MLVAAKKNSHEHHTLNMRENHFNFAAANFLHARSLLNTIRGKAPFFAAPALISKWNVPNNEPASTPPAVNDPQTINISTVNSQLSDITAKT